MAGENQFPPAAPERPSAPPTQPRRPPTDLPAGPSAPTDLGGPRPGLRDWPYWLQALVWAVAGAVVAASLTSVLGTELAAERPPAARVVYQCADGETQDTPCPSPSITRPPVTTTTELPPGHEPPPATEAAPSEPATTIPPGIYAVGEDILPGRYRSAGGSFCYWATLRGTSGEFDEIIANDISEGGAQIVEIGEEVAYFQTNGCDTWVRD